MQEHHQITSLRSRLTGALALVLLLVLAPLGAGCESAQGRAETEALETVQRRLDALNANPSHPGDPEQRARLYADVVTTLQPVRDSADPARRAAARSLIVRAQAGQGELQAAEALELRSGVIEDIGLAVRMLDRRAHHLDYARALVSYDSSDEMASLRSELAEREEALARVQLRKREAEEGIGALQGQMEERMARARELREQESRLRAEALSMPAQERATQMEAVYEMQRRADSAEVQAGNVEAELDHASPELNSINNEIQRFTAQRDLLRLSIRQLEAREDSSREQADTNRTQAADATRRFDRLILDIEERLDGELAEAFELAIRSYQSAIGTARSASTGPGVDRGVVQMSLGRLHQDLAALERSRAQVWEVFAETLRLAATSEHALPDRARFETLATTAGERRREALEAAAEAFGVARDSFQQTGLRGEAATLLERVVEDMNSLQRAMNEQAGAGEGPVSMRR